MNITLKDKMLISILASNDTTIIYNDSTYVTKNHFKPRKFDLLMLLISCISLYCLYNKLITDFYTPNILHDIKLNNIILTHIVDILYHILILASVFFLTSTLPKIILKNINKFATHSLYIDSINTSSNDILPIRKNQYSYINFLSILLCSIIIIAIQHITKIKLPSFSITYIAAYFSYHIFTFLFNIFSKKKYYIITEKGLISLTKLK